MDEKKENGKPNSGNLIPSSQQGLQVKLDDDLRTLLKQFVNEAIKFNKKQSELIDQFIKKKVRTGKTIFHFPFILKEEHVTKMESCISRRINEKYGEQPALEFVALAEYDNNDKFVYNSKEELFNSTHDGYIIRITFQWTYYVAEEVDNLTVEVPYDITIRYETEQDSDQKEMYILEEFGAILVENADTDWINQTIHDLRLIVNETKMPFWWYYPKMAYIQIREYINYVFIVIGFLVSGSICRSIFFGNIVSPNEFILETRNMPEAAQKIQAYIEYSLSNSSSANIWLYFILLTILGGVLGLLLSKAGRFLFPPSMILLGNLKDKLKNKLTAYNFIGSIVLTSLLGALATLIVGLVVG